MTQKRITPELAKQAYEKTGLKPVRGHYFCPAGSLSLSIQESCGCPAFAVACVEDLDWRVIQQKGDDPEDIEELLHDVYDPQYLAGFTIAVDDADDAELVVDDLNEEEVEQRRLGFQDGLAVRAALWPELST